METEKTLLHKVVELFTTPAMERGVALFCENKAIPVKMRVEFITFLRKAVSKITTDNHHAFRYLMDTMSHADINIFWLDFLTELKENILLNDNTGGF